MNSRYIVNDPSDGQRSDILKVSIFYGAAIFFSALILRLILAEKMPLDFDEAWYLANSSLTMEGLLPYRDFFGRSPLLLYIIGGIVDITTHDIFYGRLASVIASSFSALLLYIFANRYFSRKVAIACGLLYALSPFPLRYGYIAVTEPVSLFFVILSVYLFMRGVEEEGRYFFIFSGIVLSLAVLVRRSSAVYAAALPMFYATHYLYTKGKHTPNVKIPARRLLANIIIFIAGFSIILLSTLFLLGWRDMNLLFSMYDVRELWKYVHLEKTIIWNIKELGYQMLYLALFFLIFVSAIIKRILKDISYRYFLALTTTISIVMGYLLLPTDELEGFIARTPMDVITTILFVLPIIFAVIILFRPWDVLSTDRTGWKTSYERMLPAGIPIATAVLLPGMELSNSFVEWTLKVYLLSVFFLFLLNVRNKINSRFDKGTAQLYTGALVLVYIIYFMAISKFVYRERNVQVLISGILICGSMMFLKMYVLSRSKRLWEFFIKKIREKYFKRTVYGGGIIIIILSTFIYKNMWQNMDWTMSIFMCSSLILGFITAHIIGADLFRFEILERIWKGRSDTEPKPYILSIPLFLCVIPFFFYYLRAWWMPIYFFEMAPGLCFISGIVVVGLFHSIEVEENTSNKRREKKEQNEIVSRPVSSQFQTRRLLVYALVIISLILPSFMYASDPYNIYLNQKEQHPSPSVIRRVSMFLEENTEPGEEIFAWPIYAFQSDRHVIFNITHPLLYKEYVGEDECGLSKFNYPTVKEIMEYMDNSNVRFVVLDVNIEEVFFNQRDYFKEYIYTRYNLIKSYGNIQIMIRS